MKNQNRTRNVQLILRVTPQEHEHIKKKMALIKTNNFNAYARKMLIDGYVIEVDYPSTTSLQVRSIKSV